MKTEVLLLWVALLYAASELIMIAVEYIGKIFGKPIEQGNIEKKQKTMVIASIAAILIGSGIYLMPSVSSISETLCRYCGYIMLALAFIMHHFYVEI
ncbi:MAG: hypothetical protein E7218_01600 [Anaerofustis stercorihominis]|nr:hypothetical protein [Anaerofustis stercorihominis]